MKHFVIGIVVLGLAVLLPNESRAQLKSSASNPNISSVLSTPYNGSLFGFLDPSKLQMHHSFSMSYGSGFGQGMMLSSYMNTIDYQISEKLFLRANLGIMSSPYNTYGENFYLNKPKFFGGATLKYQINDKTSMMLRIDTAPYYYYRPTLGEYYYNRFE